MRRVTRRLAGLVFVAAIVAWYVGAFVVGPYGTPACAAQADGDRAVELRVLLVARTATDEAAMAWSDQLTAGGVPFDLVALDDGPLPTLVGPGGVGRYQAVVVARSNAADPLTSARLAEYEARFGIRHVDAVLSLPGVATANLDGVDGRVTTAGKATFDYLGGVVPVRGAFGSVPERQPGVTALVADEAGRPLVGVRVRPDGVEHLFVAPQVSPTVVHWRLLAPGLIRWATEGVHLGERRAYLAMQVDDVFLPNFLWNPETNRTERDDDTILMTGDDIRAAADWSRQRGFRLDLGYNAFGRNRELCDALLADEETFGWFNHTYSHLDLDDLPEEVIVSEIEHNRDFADGQDLPGFRDDELVTGAHTGLDNPELAAALEQAGIRRVGSDASEEPLPRTIGPARTVPRYPSEIYYDATTVEQNLDQFNWRYVEACEQNGVRCLDEPLTWAQLLDEQATFFLGRMLSNDPRVLYTHQSNLAGDRILLTFMDALLDRYEQYVTAPLTTPTLTESSDVLERQVAWSAALERGDVRAVLDGDVVRVDVVGDTAVHVPLTGVAGVGDGWTPGEQAGWVRLEPGESAELERA